MLINFFYFVKDAGRIRHLSRSNCVLQIEIVGDNTRHLYRLPGKQRRTESGSAGRLFGCLPQQRMSADGTCRDTLPDSSIKTCTLTEPLARTALAAAGYGGVGRLVALPLSTPPEIVFGFGFGVGGGRADIVSTALRIACVR